MKDIIKQHPRTRKERKKVKLSRKAKRKCCI